MKIFLYIYCIINDIITILFNIGLFDINLRCYIVLLIQIK